MSNLTIGITDDWLVEDKSTYPKHISDVVPLWYKEVKNNIDIDHQFEYLSKGRTIKSCSSFLNVFNNGYVIFSPCDILLKYNKDTDQYNWEVSYNWKTMYENQENISVHTNDQFIDYVPDHAKDLFTFKINLPYTIFTDPEYSCIQQQVPYSYNDDWYVPYGIFDTDKIHELNLQIIITSNDKEILIKKGTPLAMYLPIKREKTSLDIVDINKRSDLLKRFKKFHVSLNTKFKNTAFTLEGTTNG